VRYEDFITIIEAYGFQHARSGGSHNIYERSDLPEMVNIQNDNGKAKPYQIKQFLSLVEKYNLELDGEVNE